jgi:hypothetical protein
MEGELIIVSVISTIAGLVGLSMIQRNWTRRQEIKYKYQIKRAKLGKKLNAPVKEELTTLGTLGALAPLLKNLDGDQIAALADRFLGEDIPEEQSDIVGALTDFAMKNPDMIKGFLEGASGAKKEEKQRYI